MNRTKFHVINTIISTFLLLLSNLFFNKGQNGLSNHLLQFKMSGLKTWTIEYVDLYSDQEETLSFTCAHCQNTSIQISSVKAFLRFIHPVTQDHSHFIVVSLLIQDRPILPIIVRQDQHYISIQQPFFLMQLGKARCQSCNVQIGTEIKTANKQHLKILQGCVLIDMQKIAEIQACLGLKALLIFNAESGLVQIKQMYQQLKKQKQIKNEDSNQMDKNVALKEAMQLTQLYASYISSMQDRIDNLKEIHSYLQIMLDRQK